MASNEAVCFSVGAASCRDDRGWKPLPQGRHSIADMTVPRVTPRFLAPWSRNFNAWAKALTVAMEMN
jgi:hypothetical protein